jgi:hypothetical protein
LRIAEQEKSVSGRVPGWACQEHNVKARQEKMKQYGFRLLDRNTRRVVQDYAWFSTAGAREAVIRQSMSNQQYAIERTERESPADKPKPTEEGEVGTERSSN